MYLPKSQPKYHGRTLEYWLIKYRTSAASGNRADDRDQMDARLAIQSIGTNGISELLRLISAKDSSLTEALLKIRFFRRTLRLRPAAELNADGRAGFVVLGQASKEAVPNLVEVLRRNVSESSVACAAESLVAIGPAASEAIPSLMDASTNASPVVRSQAVFALCHIDRDTKTMIPKLTEWITDANPSVRLFAARTLGTYGKEAGSARLALEKAVNDNDAFVRRAAARSLKQLTE